METASARSADSAFCILCEKHVRLLTLCETEKTYRIVRDDIAGRGRIGTLHWLHNSRGQIRICSGSLRGTRSRRIRSAEVVILAALARA
jgi:hypothetical protein